MMFWIVGMPLRLLLVVLINLLRAPRNLVRFVFPSGARWIKVRLDGAVAERPAPRRWLPWARRRGHSVAGLEELGRVMARDPKLRGVVLEIDQIACGWARLESLRGVV